MNMKILAFNCSPRMKKSNTDRLLNLLLEGAVEADAEVERIYVRKLNLKPCLGCYSCWLKTPGACVQKDDWSYVLGRIAEADLVIWGTPVYALNMTVYMKTLLDRIGMLAILPFSFESDDGFVHIARYPESKKKAILVANGLAWNDAIFSILVDNLRVVLTKAVDEEGKPVMDMVGKILVGCGELMEWEETPQQALEPFYQTLREAGEELARNGKISPTSEDRLNVPLWRYLGINEDQQALEMVNNHYRKILELESRGADVGDA
jgi:multimeric flavodoxin WrbA